MRSKETTGEGTLAGMIVGGALGLVTGIGPTGVIIGGLLGAFAGNELEKKSQ